MYTLYDQSIVSVTLLYIWYIHIIYYIYIKIIYSINSKFKRNVTQELLLVHIIIFDRNC